MLNPLMPQCRPSHQGPCWDWHLPQQHREKNTLRQCPPTLPSKKSNFAFSSVDPPPRPPKSRPRSLIPNDPTACCCQVRTLLDVRPECQILYLPLACVSIANRTFAIHGGGQRGWLGCMEDKSPFSLECNSMPIFCF